MKRKAKLKEISKVLGHPMSEAGKDFWNQVLDESEGKKPTGKRPGEKR